MTDSRTAVVTQMKVFEDDQSLYWIDIARTRIMNNTYMNTTNIETEKEQLLITPEFVEDKHCHYFLFYVCQNSHIFFLAK